MDHLVSNWQNEKMQAQKLQKDMKCTVYSMKKSPNDFVPDFKTTTLTMSAGSVAASSRTLQALVVT